MIPVVQRDDELPLWRGMTAFELVERDGELRSPRSRLESCRTLKTRVVVCLFTCVACCTCLLAIHSISFSGKRPPSTGKRSGVSTVGRLLTREPQRYLLFPLHSGASNQLIEIRRALMLGAILNRTVVIPPVQRHFDIVYHTSDGSMDDAGTWNHREREATRISHDNNWTFQEMILNMTLEFSEQYFQQGDSCRAFSGLYDASYFNVSFLDLSKFYHDICASNLSIRGGCAGSNLAVTSASAATPSKTENWKTIADVTRALAASPLDEARILAVSSTFRTHSLDGLSGLASSTSRLQDVVARLQQAPIPFSKPILDAAERVAQAITSASGAFSAFHLRMSDTGYAELDTVATTAQWALAELAAAGVPANSSVYIATNLREGCGHDGLRELRSKYRCFSLAGMPTSQDLLCEAGLGEAGLCDRATQRSNLSSLTGQALGDLMAALDKQVCVLAERGFWPSFGCCSSCAGSQCPPKVSASFANDIISRRAQTGKPSCMGDSTLHTAMQRDDFNETFGQCAGSHWLGQFTSAVFKSHSF